MAELLDDGLNLDGEEELDAKTKAFLDDVQPRDNYYTVLNSHIKARESDMLQAKQNLANKSELLKSQTMRAQANARKSKLVSNAQKRVSAASAIRVNPNDLKVGLLK